MSVNSHPSDEVTLTYPTEQDLDEGFCLYFSSDSDSDSDHSRMLPSDSSLPKIQVDEEVTLPVTTKTLAALAQSTASHHNNNNNNTMNKRHSGSSGSLNYSVSKSELLRLSTMEISSQNLPQQQPPPRPGSSISSSSHIPPPPPPPPPAIEDDGFLLGQEDIEMALEAYHKKVRQEKNQSPDISGDTDLSSAFFPFPCGKRAVDSQQDTNSVTGSETLTSSIYDLCSPCSRISPQIKWVMLFAFAIAITALMIVIIFQLRQVN